MTTAVGKTVNAAVSPLIEPLSASLSIEITARRCIPEAGVLERCGFRSVGASYMQAFDLTQELAPRAPLGDGFEIRIQGHLDSRQTRQFGA